MSRQTNGLSRRQMLQGSLALSAVAGFEALHISEMAAQDRTWDRETDVVVVGTGAAGTPAALEAARAGAQVIRLEKVAAVGGNMSHSQGIIMLGGGTALQQQNGIEDSAEAMVTYLAAFMGPWEKLDHLQYYAENSAAHYDWLVENGVTFGDTYYPGKMITAPEGGGLSYCDDQENYPYPELTQIAPRGHCVNGYGAAMSVALEAQVSAEAGITTLVNAPARRLIVNDEGRVVGVVAEIEGVVEYILARKGVILAAGGYEFDKELTDQTVIPKYGLNPVGSSYQGNTGDTIKLAGSVGGRSRHMDHTFSTPFVYPPNEACQGILVNALGRRFVNEASYGAVLGDHVIYRQNGIAWLIFDDRMIQEIAAVGRTYEPFAVADTLAELAAAIDVPAEMFEAEIALYNSFAESGTDLVARKNAEFLTAFGEGPYYAIDFRAGPSTPAMTTGHIEVNLDTQVVNQWSEPVPGLWAAGQGGPVIGKRHYNSGIRLGEGSLFGRVAGKNAAANESWDGEFDFSGVQLDVAASGTPGASPVAEVDLSSAALVVAAGDLFFDPVEISIAADSDVVVGITNVGVIPHDFAIEGTDFATPLIDPGADSLLTVNLPAGTYTFYCTVAGHRAAGMEGVLTVS